MTRLAKAGPMAAGLLALAATAAAQTTPSASSTELSPITITATPGLEQRIRDVQASIEVIGRDVIDATPGTSVARVLQEAAGLTVLDGGSSTLFSMRGFSYTQSLFLVDGQRRRGRIGLQDLTNVNLAEVERIEIIRGPMSALYGADAISGVVNIITRRPGEVPGANLNAMVGTVQQGGRTTGILSGGVDTGAVGPTRHRLAASISDRSSWAAQNSQFDDLLSLERRFASYTGEYTVAEGHDLRLRAEYGRQSDSGLGSNGAAVPRPTNAYERQEDTVGQLTYNGQLGASRLQVTGSVWRSNSEVRRAGTVNTTLLNGQEVNAYWNIAPFTGNQLTVGVTMARETIALNSIRNGDRARQTFGVVVQDQWTLLPDLRLVAGLRYDNYSDFGDTINPRVSLAYTPDNWTFRIGGGSAFRAPLFQELYTVTVRGASTIFGNPALKPEEAVSYEAAIGYRFGPGTELQMIYHQSEVRNLISVVSTARNRFDYRNTSRADLRGVELQGSARLSSSLRLRGSGEWLEADDGITHRRLVQRARWQGRGGVDWDITDSTTLHVGGRMVLGYWSGTRNNPTTNPVSKDHARLDFRVTHRITDSVAVYAGIDGVAGNTPPFSFGTVEPPGRFFYGGLSINF